MDSNADVARRAAAMLRELEWSNDDMWCPRCNGGGKYGHTSRCDLWPMIQALEAVEGTAATVQRKENK